MQSSRDVPAGQWLFREGDRSTEFYLLLSGAVEVVKGEEVIAQINKPMSYFGEMAALLNEPRSASIRTATDSKFLVIPGAKMDSIIDVSPAVGKRIMRTLCERLLETNRAWQEADAGFKDISSKKKDEMLTAIQEYKRLLYVIGLLFKETRLPLVKELFEFAKGNSKMSAFAARLDLDPTHFERYPEVARLVTAANPKPAPPAG